MPPVGDAPGAGQGQGQQPGQGQPTPDPTPPSPPPGPPAGSPTPPPPSEPNGTGSTGTTTPTPTDQPPPGEAGQPGQQQEPPQAAVDYTGLKAPEGVPADDPALDQLKLIAGKHKLPVDAAQELLDLHHGIAAEQQRIWQEQGNAWAAAVKADPFLTGYEVAKGGFKNLAEAEAMAARARAKYLDAPTVKLLVDLGLGNHPKLFRAFAEIGRELAEDQAVAADGSSRADPLRSLFNHPSSSFMFQAGN
jgi:hypothetical protein